MDGMDFVMHDAQHSDPQAQQRQPQTLSYQSGCPYWQNRMAQASANRDTTIHRQYDPISNSWYPHPFYSQSSRAAGGAGAGEGPGTPGSVPLISGASGGARSGAGGMPTFPGSQQPTRHPTEAYYPQGLFGPVQPTLPALNQNQNQHPAHDPFPTPFRHHHPGQRFLNQGVHLPGHHVQPFPAVQARALNTPPTSRSTSLPSLNLPHNSQDQTQNVARHQRQQQQQQQQQQEQAPQQQQPPQATSSSVDHPPSQEAFAFGRHRILFSPGGGLLHPGPRPEPTRSHSRHGLSNNASHHVAQAGQSTMPARPAGDSDSPLSGAGPPLDNGRRLTRTMSRSARFRTHFHSLGFGYDSEDDAEHRDIMDGPEAFDFLEDVPAETARTGGFPFRIGDLDEAGIRAQQLIRGQVSTKRVASRAALAALQSVEIDTLSENERVCVICYNEFGVPNPEGINEAPLRLPKCKHIFGDHCIKKWFEESDSCPYCRDKLPSEPRFQANSEGLRELLRTATYAPRALAVVPGEGEVFVQFFTRGHAPRHDGSPPRSWQAREHRAPTTDNPEPRRRTRPRHGSFRSATSGTGSQNHQTTRPSSFAGPTTSASMQQSPARERGTQPYLAPSYRPPSYDAHRSLTPLTTESYPSGTFGGSNRRIPPIMPMPTDIRGFVPSPQVGVTDGAPQPFAPYTAQPLGDQDALGQAHLGSFAVGSAAHQPEAVSSDSGGDNAHLRPLSGQDYYPPQHQLNTQPYSGSSHTTENPLGPGGPPQ
ncbi:hypothetical protein VTK73DRAFT_2801 [Phialemonium thermophilum]|uniref:RING-type domain-containing protein n=1 Tax=Phialemonium thermophilum TaxID=223376 RepID=A0ABR3X3I1_9PEZI